VATGSRLARLEESEWKNLFFSIPPFSEIKRETAPETNNTIGTIFGGIIEESGFCEFFCNFLFFVGGDGGELKSLILDMRLV